MLLHPSSFCKEESGKAGVCNKDTALRWERWQANLETRPPIEKSVIFLFRDCIFDIFYWAGLALYWGEGGGDQAELGAGARSLVFGWGLLGGGWAAVMTESAFCLGTRRLLLADEKRWGRRFLLCTVGGSLDRHWGWQCWKGGLCFQVFALQTRTTSPFPSQGGISQLALARRETLLFWKPCRSGVASTAWRFFFPLQPWSVSLC